MCLIRAGAKLCRAVALQELSLRPMVYGDLTCTAVRLLPFLPSAPITTISASAVLSGRTTNVLLGLCLRVHVSFVGHVQSHSEKLLLSDYSFVFLSVSLSLF